MLEYLIPSTEMGLITGFLTLGVFISFRLAPFTDLTCDGSALIGAAITAALADLGVNPWLNLFLSFLGGSCAGLCTAFFHHALNIPQIFSGILTSVMAYSVSLHIMDSRPVIALHNAPLLFQQETTLMFMIPLIPCNCICLLYLFLNASWNRSSSSRVQPQSRPALSGKTRLRYICDFNDQQCFSWNIWRAYINIPTIYRY